MIIQLQNATSRAVATMHKGGEIANQSVNDAQAASVILAKIASSIDEINDMSAQIATAAEEQASVTLEINNNTETIKEVGDTMSRSSELARNSALVLKKLGEDINAEVSQFTL
jgi:methyl-accepting chemotaxis protein